MEPNNEDIQPETEDERLTRLAKDWIASGSSGTPPKLISKRIQEIKHPPKPLKIEPIIEETHVVSSMDKPVAVNPYDLKIQEFLEEWINNGGNSTKAAMKIYGIKNKYTANNVGVKQLKKCKGAVRLLLESKGFSYGKMLEVATTKMDESRNPDWWDRLMKLAGYEDFMTKNQATPIVNVFQTQRELQEEFGFEEGELVDDNTETTAQEV